MSTGYLDTSAIDQYERVVVCPYVHCDELWVARATPRVLYVGTRMAQHPVIMARVVKDDRERLVQVQE